MGIPKFYRWLSERYPLINEKVTDTQYLPPVDGLYLDLNSVIHNSTHRNDGLTTEKAPEDIAQDLFNYIDHIILTIKPKRTLFMAVDGVAPRAKLNQQRARRFRAGKTKEDEVQALEDAGINLEGKVFDSNCITPGTEFMEQVDQYFLYLLHAKLSSDPLWQRMDIIYSGHNVPGEGEHKIMAYLRDLFGREDYDPCQRHCIYGLDADLILLSLSLHDANVMLLREVVDFSFKGKPKKKDDPAAPTPSKKKIYNSTWDILHINLLREYLFLDMAPEKDFSWYDKEKAIDDFVFMMIFSGDDFMPQLPALDINDECIEMFMDIYKEALPKMKGHIVNDAIPNPKNLKLILKALGKREQDAYERLMAKENGKKGRGVPKEKYYDDVTYEEKSLEAIPGGLPILRSDKQVENTLKKIQNATFKDRYYLKKFNLFPSQEEVKEEICLNYYQGLCWVMQYYYRGVPSWTWYYAYHYSPFASDLCRYIPEERTVHFEKGEPLLPFQQQMGCLPLQSIALLPPLYRSLLTNPSSLIYKYYPKNFRIDMNGKVNDWEGIAIIPFIDEKLLKRAMKEAEAQGSLTDEEKKRNTFGKDRLYRYCPTLSFCYPSPLNKSIFPDLTECHCEGSDYIIRSPLKRQEEAYKNNSKLLPSTPSIYNLKVHYRRENLKITVMGRISKNHTILLSVQPHLKTSMVLNANMYAVFAKNILGKICWYGYPHMRMAVITGVYTSEMFFGYKTKDRDPTNIITRKNTTNETNTFHYCIDWYKRNLAQGSTGALGFGGVEIPSVYLILVLSPLVTLKYDPTITPLVRKYSTKSILVPFDLVQFKNNNLPLELREENHYLHPELLYQPQMDCIYVGPGKYGAASLYGAKGHIVTFKDKELIICVTIEPEEPSLWEEETEKKHKYYSVKHIAKRLNVPVQVIETITGNYIVDSQMNIGLQLHTDKSALLGYCQGWNRTSTSTWNYEDYNVLPAIYAPVFENKKSKRVTSLQEEAENGSTIEFRYNHKAIDLIKRYLHSFPELIEGMMKNDYTVNGQVLLGPTHKDYLLRVQDFLQHLDIYTIPYIPFNSEMLENEHIQKLQQRVDQYQKEKEEQRQQGTWKTFQVKMTIKPEQVVTSRVDPYQLYPQEQVPNSPVLGQRILNIRQGDCSYGEKGTVIGIYGESREVVVLFDRPFIGNEDLGGVSAPCRISVIPWLYCISMNEEVAIGTNPHYIVKV